MGLPLWGSQGDNVGNYQLLHDAFRASSSLGVLWFAAASQTSGVGIPGAFDEVVAVGALNEDLTRRIVSPVHPKIELVAPGDGRYSWNRRDDDPGFPYTNVASGTSFAAPIAAGVARLAWQAYPTWSAATLRAELRQHARDLGAAGRDNAYGYGMPDAVCLIRQYSPCLPPVSVGMLGPDHIGSEGGDNWTAQPSGGTGSYQYLWEYATDGASWSEVGYSSTYYRSTYYGDPSFQLRVTVTSGQEPASTTKWVSVNIPPPCGPMAC